MTKRTKQAAEYAAELNSGGRTMSESNQQLNKVIKAALAAPPDVEDWKDTVVQIHLALSRVRSDATDCRNWRAMIDNIERDIAALTTERDQLRSESESYYEVHGTLPTQFGHQQRDEKTVVAAALAAPPDVEGADWKAKFEREEKDHSATIRDRDWMSDLLRNITLTITGETDIYGDPAIAYQTAADELPRILQAVRCDESGDESTGEAPAVSAMAESNGGAAEVSVIATLTTERDQLRSEVERLRDCIQNVICDPGSTALCEATMAQCQAVRGPAIEQDKYVVVLRSELARLADGREGERSDDGEETTSEWLQSVGFLLQKVGEGDDERAELTFEFLDCTDCWSVATIAFESNVWLGVDSRDWRQYRHDQLGKVNKRGDVRLLCRALGISLKETERQVK